ncbi:hypothetical protein SAMN05518668_101370 [Sphingobium sp. YR657]|nr:hypothetical protein SAMN05518668_101370 [Sphingobium sp. YR657]
MSHPCVVALGAKRGSAIAFSRSGKLWDRACQTRALLDMARKERLFQVNLSTGLRALRFRLGLIGGGWIWCRIDALKYDRSFRSRKLEAVPILLEICAGHVDDTEIVRRQQKDRDCSAIGAQLQLSRINPIGFLAERHEARLPSFALRQCPRTSSQIGLKRRARSKIDTQIDARNVGAVRCNKPDRKFPALSILDSACGNRRRHRSRLAGKLDSLPHAPPSALCSLIKRSDAQAIFERTVRLDAKARRQLHFSVGIFSHYGICGDGPRSV